MQLSDSPKKLLLPFAKNGNKNNIPVASQIGIVPGAASLADGFPPLTMTPVAAGGVPPSGFDMNGILYEMSAIDRWAVAGGSYTFDPTFATDGDISGYPKGAKLLRADANGFWLNQVDGNSTDPDSDSAVGWVPQDVVGVKTVPMSNANIILNNANGSFPLFKITGTLAANLNLIVPNFPGRQWLIWNAASGNFAITVKTASGTGIAIPTGQVANIYCDDSSNISALNLPANINLRAFGAKGDGVNYDDTAVNNWLAFVKTSGISGYAPSGRYLMQNQFLIDLASCSSVGLSLHGDGMQRTIFDLSGISSGVPFQLKDSNGSIDGDSFYVSLERFGVHTNIAGVGAAIGTHDLSDAINASVFDRLYFANASSNASAVALEVNFVVQSTFNVTTNCGTSSGGGDSIKLRQAQFCTFTGSGGNSANSMHLTDGYVFGNTILNWDAEECQKCYLIDVATASSNTFIGGQLSCTVAGIDGLAGSNNIFINPNFGMSSNKVASKNGISVIGDGKAYGTIVMPTTIVRPPAGDAIHYVDATAGQQGSYIFMRNNVRRWKISMDNGAESGSNAGSSLVITRYDDSGNSLGDAMYITRSNGITTINKAALATVGFFGAGLTATRPTVSGARAGNAALTSLIGVLSSLGLINDTTSA